MTAPDMSDACKQYIRWTIQGVPRSGFQYLSQLQDEELFRALAVPAREDIEDLFSSEPEAPIGFAPEIPGPGGRLGPSSAALGAAQMGGQVLTRLPQMAYAYQIVMHGKLTIAHISPPTAQAHRWAQNYVHHCVALREIPLNLDEDLTDQLPTPVANPPVLSESDYAAAARTLGVDVAAMKAVAQVESSGAGFGADGSPKIRYELHRFQSKTQKHFHKTHPYLSQASLAAGNPYHNGTQDREYSMLYNAMLLHYKGDSMTGPAIESASWGKFQVMGENWKNLGWSSALKFASDMYVSEANHLTAFVRFVQHKGLTSALKRHQWAAFAAGYNGSSYAVNHYDTNMERAFNRLSKAAAHR